MAARTETRQQALALREAVLRDCRNGTWAPGDALPPVRELALRNGISTSTAQRVLKTLADEGILQLRHGSGAFVGHIPEFGQRALLAIFANEVDSSSQLIQMRAGFEAEISRRAATSILVTPNTTAEQRLLRHVAAGEWQVGGVFMVPGMDAVQQSAANELAGRFATLPAVTYYEETENLPAQRRDQYGDLVHFDDREGGNQAVRHLWSRGHRGLAFLSLHKSGVTGPPIPWSGRREAGFVAATEALAGQARVFQSIRPLASLEFESQIQAGYEAAKQLIPHLLAREVTAVVCVNQFAFQGLVRATRDANLSEEFWPEIVAFDDEASDDHLLSVLRLPWDDLGRAAAGALWERVFGTPEQRNSPWREILVPMRLVARLHGRAPEFLTSSAAAFAANRTQATAGSPGLRPQVF